MTDSVNFKNWEHNTMSRNHAFNTDCSRRRIYPALLSLLLAVGHFSTPVAAGSPLASVFTYQGWLDQNLSPADGIFDFQFEIYDVETFGSPIDFTVTADDIPVSNGLFTVELDFGGAVFQGEERWLEVGVREGSSIGAYTVLSPRQRLTAVPYTLHASHAESADGAIAADDADNLDGLDSTDFLRTTGGFLTGALTVNGMVHSTSGGIKFPDNTLQTTAASGGSGDGHSLDAADGNPTDVVFVDNTGNVGVGTTSPNARLSVNGSLVVGDGTAGGGFAAAVGQISTASGANALAAGFNSTASGDHSTALGLGPTASGIVATAIGDNTKATGNISTAIGSFTTAQSYASVALGRWNELAGSGTSWVSTDPLFVIGNGSSSSARANAVTVLKNGFVGIGKTNPAARLVVNGPIVWGGSGARLDTDQGASIEVRGTGFPYIDLTNDAGADYDMRLKLSGDNSLTIEGGRVGIGGTMINPQYKLDLPNVAGPDGQGRANAWVTYSSVRWKEQIRDLEDPTAKLRRLRGVEFDWKEEYGGTPGIGFVAEEVGEVLPELVEWEEDGRYAKGLHYSGIVPLLVEAVKAQSVTIERQQEELAQLKALVCRDQQEVGPCQ